MKFSFSLPTAGWGKQTGIAQNNFYREAIKNLRQFDFQKKDRKSSANYNNFQQKSRNLLREIMCSDRVIKNQT